MGAAELAFYNSLWEQAASQGMSVFVASGDAGAAGCQQGNSTYGNGSRGERAVQFALCHVRGRDGVQRRRECGAVLVRDEFGGPTARRWATFPRRCGTRARWTAARGCGRRAAARAWCTRSPRGRQRMSGAGAASGMRAVPDVALSAANHDGYFMVENGAFWVVSGTSVLGAGVCRHHGAGHGEGKRQRPRQRESSTLCAGERGCQIHFIPRCRATTAFPALTGFTADGADVQPRHGPGIGGWRTARQRMEREFDVRICNARFDVAGAIGNDRRRRLRDDSVHCSHWRVVRRVRQFFCERLAGRSYGNVVRESAHAGIERQLKQRAAEAHGRSGNSPGLIQRCGFGDGRWPDRGENHHGHGRRACEQLCTLQSAAYELQTAAAHADALELVMMLEAD